MSLLGRGVVVATTRGFSILASRIPSMALSHVSTAYFQAAGSSAHIVSPLNPRIWSG